MLAKATEFDITGTVNLEDCGAVADAACRTLRTGFGALMAGERFLRRAFADIGNAYWGGYPGLLHCDTPYHDLRHALDTALLVARMADGWRQCGDVPLSPDDAALAVFLGLFHDIGFLRRHGEEHLTGAQLMREHEGRSVAFARAYLGGSPLAALADGAELIQATNFAHPFAELVAGRRPQDAVIAALVGSADLISQVSDRCYLERCRDFLFGEFAAAGCDRTRTPNGETVVLYDGPIDLLEKTPAFYENYVRHRLQVDFGGIDRALSRHFQGSNPYQASIERNLRYLTGLIEDGALAEGLRRHPAPLMPKR